MKLFSCIGHGIDFLTQSSVNDLNLPADESSLNHSTFTWNFKLLFPQFKLAYINHYAKKCLLNEKGLPEIENFCNFRYRYTTTRYVLSCLSKADTQLALIFHSVLSENYPAQHLACTKLWRQMLFQLSDILPKTNKIYDKMRPPKQGENDFAF